MSRLAFQPEFRPVLPTVFGAKDYQVFRATIEQIDDYLVRTGIENRLLAEYMEQTYR